MEGHIPRLVAACGLRNFGYRAYGAPELVLAARPKAVADDGVADSAVAEAIQGDVPAGVSGAQPLATAAPPEAQHPEDWSSPAERLPRTAAPPLRLAEPPGRPTQPASLVAAFPLAPRPAGIRRPPLLIELSEEPSPFRIAARAPGSRPPISLPPPAPMAEAGPQALRRRETDGARPPLVLPPPEDEVQPSGFRALHEATRRRNMAPISLPEPGEEVGYPMPKAATPAAAQSPLSATPTAPAAPAPRAARP